MWGQCLQHQPHLHRSEAVHHVELVRNAHDLSEALDFPAPRQVISAGEGVAMIVEQPDGGRPVPFAAFAGTSRHDTVFRRTVRPRCGFPPFRIMPWVAGMAARGIGRHGVLLRHAKQRSLPPGKDLRRRHRHRSAPWRPQSFPRPSPWLLRLVLELGVQRLALFHGELALLHQTVDDLLALLKALLPQLNAGGQCPNAREKHPAQAFTQIEISHDTSFGYLWFQDYPPPVA